MGAHSVIQEVNSVPTGSTFVAITAAMGLASVSGMVPTSVANASTVLDNIVQCESSGNQAASNGTHFGLFQFDMPTWHSVGGTGDPRNASISEQYARAEKLMALRGTQPWDASRSCWSGKPVDTVKAKIAVKDGPVVSHVDISAKIPVKRPTVPTPIYDEVAAAVSPHTTHVVKHVVKHGDTLSQIAEAYNVKGGWTALYNLNRHIIGNPNSIFIGQTLRLV